MMTLVKIIGAGINILINTVNMTRFESGSSKYRKIFECFTIHFGIQISQYQLYKNMLGICKIYFEVMLTYV